MPGPVPGDTGLLKDQGQEVCTVTHGATAGTARPTLGNNNPVAAAQVYWIGSVTPTHAISGDLWWDTTNLLVKVHNGSSFDAAGSATYVPKLGAVVSVKAAPYSAKADGTSVTDATIASGTNQLHSTAAAFTGADAGKYVLVQGAAAAGADLITTISSVSAGIATLAVTAGTTIASNGRAYYGTDDTAAIQAAIDAVTAAGGGSVLFPPGWYIVAGAFKDTGAASGVTGAGLAYRAQITIPDVALAQAKVPLSLIGAAPMQWFDYPHAQIGRTNPAAGAFLVSLSNGEAYSAHSKLPSMIGGPDPANMLTQPVTPTNVALTVDGIGFLTPRNPQLCAANFCSVVSGTFDHLYVSTFDWVDDFTTQPTHPVGIGVFFPGFGNWANIGAEQITVSGYYCGYIAGEHLFASSLYSFLNYIGTSWTEMLHVGKINGFDCGETKYPIAYNDFTGSGLASASQPAILIIDGMEIEAFGVTAWYNLTNVVYDPANKITATIRYNLFSETWSVNGATNVIARPVGDAAISASATSGQKVTGGGVETTTSTTYTDLFSAGPAVTVTVPPSGRVLMLLRCGMSNSSAGAYSLCSVALSGANTVAASEDYLFMESAIANHEVGHGVPIYLTGLTPGATTFTMKYRVTGGTGSFGFRYLTVLPL